MSKKMRHKKSGHVKKHGFLRVSAEEQLSEIVVSAHLIVGVNK